MAHRAPKLVLAAAAITALVTGCGAQGDPLADEVWASIEEYYPDGFPADDLLAGVTKVEDISPGTIRVYVQFELTDAERQQVADDVQGLGYDDRLETIVIQDSTGLDSNHFFN